MPLPAPVTSAIFPLLGIELNPPFFYSEPWSTNQPPSLLANEGDDVIQKTLGDSDATGIVVILWFRPCCSSLVTCGSIPRCVPTLLACFKDRSSSYVYLSQERQHQAGQEWPLSFLRGNDASA